MAPHSEHSPGFSSRDEPATIDIPVLIVGGGPTGLLEAHMLSKLGGLRFHRLPVMISLTFSSQISRY